MWCLGFEWLSPTTGEKQSQEHSQKSKQDLLICREIAWIKESNTRFKGTAPGLLSPASWRSTELFLMCVFSPKLVTVILLERDPGTFRLKAISHSLLESKEECQHFKMLLLCMTLKNGFNDHFQVGWKPFNSLLLLGGTVWLSIRLPVRSSDTSLV